MLSMIRVHTTGTVNPPDEMRESAMINISNDGKTAELSAGSSLYTEDGINFTHVEKGRIVLIIEACDLREAFNAVATVGPVPDNVESLFFTPIKV
jgi:hypothetical protein